MSNKWPFNIQMIPRPKPVITSQGKHSARAKKYYTYCNNLRLRARGKFDPQGRAAILNVDYYIPMPESWSKEKKRLTVGTLHTSKPDCDNLCKALNDALVNGCDSKIAGIIAFKYWCYLGDEKIVGHFETVLRG